MIFYVITDIENYGFSHPNMGTPHVKLNLIIKKQQIKQKPRHGGVLCKL